MAYNKVLLALSLLAVVAFAGCSKKTESTSRGNGGQTDGAAVEQPAPTTAPAVETPAVEAPAAPETPAVEAPAVETPVVEPEPVAPAAPAAPAPPGAPEPKPESTPEPAATGQATPKAALATMIGALESGDIEKMLSVVEANEDQKKMFGAVAGFFKTASEFNGAAKAQFGDDWDQESGNFKMDNSLEEIKAKLDQVEVKVDGDKATLTAPDHEDEPIKMVRKDGKWYVSNISDQMPSDPKEIAQAVKIMGAMSEAMKSLQPRIAAEGMTAQKLKEEMGMAVMAAMMATGMTDMEQD